MRLLAVAGLMLSLTAPAQAQETLPGEPPEDENAAAAATAVPPPPAASDTEDDDRGWLRGRSGRLQRPVLPPRVRHRREDGPRRWFFLMEAGPMYGKLYGLSMYGAEGSMAADREFKNVAVTIGATFGYAWLEPGLGVTQFQAGSTVMAKEGILRVGAGLGLGLVSISSVTADTGAIGVALDISALMTLDLVKFSEDGSRAFYAGAKLRGALILAGDAQPVLWGPVGVLGFRL